MASHKAKSAKKKKKHLRHPLTLLDKSIYCIFMAAAFIGIILLYVALINVQRSIAFSDADVIALADGPRILFALPLIFFLELSALVAPICALETKTPIFGSRKYKYGEYPFTADRPPLIRRSLYSTYKKPSKKRLSLILTFIAVWCVLLIFFSSFLFPCLIPREVLTRDNCIEEIGLFNNVEKVYTVDDYTHLTVSIHRMRSKASVYWSYGIKIKMSDGKSFYLSNREFNRDIPGGHDFYLDKMLEIKSLFPSDKITVEGERLLDKATEHLKLNEVQKNKLRELISE